MFGLFSRKQAESSDEEAWMLFVGEVQGKPVIYRLRAELPADFDPQGYPSLIRITWTYDGTEAGMPNDDDQVGMTALEDVLEREWEARGKVCMTFATTGNYERAWHLYASNGEETMALLDHLSKSDAFPIATSHEHDPEWTAYREIRDAAIAR